MGKSYIGVKCQLFQHDLKSVVKKLKLEKSSFRHNLASAQTV